MTEQNKYPATYTLGALSGEGSLDRGNLEALSEKQAKFVIEALVAAGRVRPWAANMAIGIAKDLAERE